VPLRQTGKYKFGMKYFLSIAASDNSGGAGIQQDLKVAEDLGYWGLTAITGITVQNFEKLENIFPVSSSVLAGQLDMNVKSFKINCIKIGAICSENNIRIISEKIKNKKFQNIVVDPVFAPTSGKEFLAPKSLKIFTETLLPLADIITPNKNELSVLTGKTFVNFNDGIDAARIIVQTYGCYVYLKGGHFDGVTIKEALITSNDVTIFEKKRLKLSYTHGTG
jgi:hydroxymethylpyrimidine/phosphomethylpyrimidine kinase